MLNNSKIVLPTAYFPPISYFSEFLDREIITIEKYENYQKQTFRNRCKILGANGILTLSVPIIKGRSLKVLIKDVEIAYSENWQKLHWKSIESAYRSSPFFEFYADDIYPFFSKKYKFLLDFNLEIIEVLKSHLQLDTLTKYTVNFVANNEALNFKHHKGKRKSNEITEYTQVFSDRHGFASDLSVIDLLFNTGSEAYNFL